ncbi:hypothetical protein [Spartinivicinus poritis]|uniref:Uncharacterized protein n=1 Tax=Spartinivicinus poritis TaxID=2994640 RepID=A0ABT5UDS6_9GAMM|nr:hypothetical protein [Spartinivicinus sp. A2-2]MDE1464530.1 hypothetical protein [Spartinivicinus sp. A2-2]
MKKTINTLLFCFLAMAPIISYSAPEIYLFLGGNSAESSWKELNNKNINGAQIIYRWRKLEPKKGHYNFEAIEQDLKFLSKYNKKLFIQIQDRTFSPKAIPVPKYLLTEEYDGGIVRQYSRSNGKEIGEGWVAKQWNPKVRERFQALLIALGKNFDGIITGINLPETAIDISQKLINPKFCGTYFLATLENMSVLKKAFNKSFAVQYVNFFPCNWNNDQGYMSRLFSFAIEKKIGLGNPDTVPFRKGQMENSYPFFNKNKDLLSITSFAVQEPDYNYINPKTKKKFTIAELYDFLSQYIMADIIFWNTQQPEFSEKVLPFLNNRASQ